MSYDPMKYGKARGAKIVLQLWPKCTPFTDIDLVKTAEELEGIKSKYGDFVLHMVDYPLGKSAKNAVAGTSGCANEIPDLIRRVDAQDAGGVVLLMKATDKGCEHYLYEVDLILSSHWTAMR